MRVYTVYPMYVSGVLLVCCMMDILRKVWWTSKICTTLWQYK